MQKIRWIDVVHVLGSVASITGISLLWFKSQLNIQTLVIDIPVIGLLVLFSLGLVSLGIIAVRFGYTRLFKNSDSPWQFAYFSISIPILCFIIGWCLFFFWYLTLKEISIMKG